jgi:hypothetical protein
MQHEGHYRNVSANYTAAKMGWKRYHKKMGANRTWAGSGRIWHEECELFSFLHQPNSCCARSCMPPWRSIRPCLKWSPEAFGARATYGLFRFGLRVGQRGPATRWRHPRPFDPSWIPPDPFGSKWRDKSGVKTSKLRVKKTLSLPSWHLRESSICRSLRYSRGWKSTRTPSCRVLYPPAADRA